MTSTRSTSFNTSLTVSIDVAGLTEIPALQPVFFIFRIRDVISEHASTWTVIKSDCKKRARINAMRHILNKLDYPNKNTDVAVKPDKLIVGSAQYIYEKGEHILDKAPMKKGDKDK